MPQNADKFDHQMYGIARGSKEIMRHIGAQDAIGLGDQNLVESSEQAMLAQAARSGRRKG